MDSYEDALTASDTAEAVQVGSVQVGSVPLNPEAEGWTRVDRVKPAEFSDPTAPPVRQQTPAQLKREALAEAREKRRSSEAERKAKKEERLARRHEDWDRLLAQVAESQAKITEADGNRGRITLELLRVALVDLKRDARILGISATTKLAGLKICAEMLNLFEAHQLAGATKIDLERLSTEEIEMLLALTLKAEGQAATLDMAGGNGARRQIGCVVEGASTDKTA